MLIKNIDTYIAKNNYSQFVKDYFLDISKKGTKEYIKNIDLDIKFIEIDDFLIPLVFGNSQNNCYTASFLSTLDYGNYELRNIKNYSEVLFYKLFIKILKIFGKIIKVEDIVYVNNFLLSTNLYPNFNEDTLLKINNFINNNYKNKVIVYKSLNKNNNNDIINKLENYGFKKIVSRQIFIFESKFLNKYNSLKVVKNDLRIIRKYWFDMLKCSEEDSQDIYKLYNQLYLKKYTSLNPQFNKNFIRILLKNKNFYFFKLMDNNKIIGIYGYFIVNNQATTPFFGYDLDYDKKYNLYSQISNFLTFNVLNKIEYLNSSSGAGKFKMARGAKKYLEYNYFYLPKNISFFKKLYFSILFLISDKILEKQFKDNTY